jgi:hypothetical protein
MRTGVDSEFEFTEHQDDSVVPEQIVNTPAGANTDLDSNNNFAGHSCNDDVIHETVHEFINNCYLDG